MPAVRKGLPAPRMLLGSHKPIQEPPPPMVTIIGSLDQLPVELDDLPPLSADGIVFPVTAGERERYRTKAGKVSTLELAIVPYLPWFSASHSINGPCTTSP